MAGEWCASGSRPFGCSKIGVPLEPEVTARLPRTSCPAAACTPSPESGISGASPRCGRQVDQSASAPGVAEPSSCCRAACPPGQGHRSRQLGADPRRGHPARHHRIPERSEPEERRGLRAPPSTQWHREVRDLRECAVRPAALFLLCRWSARSAWAISLSSSWEGRGGWIDQSPIRGLSPSG